MDTFVEHTPEGTFGRRSLSIHRPFLLQIGTLSVEI